MNHLLQAGRAHDAVFMAMMQARPETPQVEVQVQRTSTRLV